MVYMANLFDLAAFHDCGVTRFLAGARFDLFIDLSGGFLVQFVGILRCNIIYIFAVEFDLNLDLLFLLS
jgi:hypothetical protein